MSMSMYTQSPLFLSLSLCSLAFILKLIRIIKIFSSFFRYIYITKKCLDIYCSKSLNVYSFIRIQFIFSLSVYFLLYIILSFNVISFFFLFFYRCDHVISIEFLFFFLAMFLLFLLIK